MAFFTTPGVTAIPVGDEQIVLGAAATPLTVPVGYDANSCIISVEAQSVRWRDAGVPTAAIGQILTPGAVFEYTGDLTKLQFFRLAAGAILNVSYYKLSVNI